jgi:hypothetical protein
MQVLTFLPLPGLGVRLGEESTGPGASFAFPENCMHSIIDLRCTSYSTLLHVLMFSLSL